MNTNDTVPAFIRNPEPPAVMNHKQTEPGNEEKLMLAMSGKSFMMRIVGRSGTKLQMDCTTPDGQNEDANFYCETAAKALVRHRTDHDCDCDFVHLGRRKRITVRPHWLEPKDHLNYQPTRTCLLHNRVGLIVRAAMQLHDQCCKCGGFGDPQEYEELSYPTRATALAASRVLPQFQDCDAKFYMQEAMVRFWQQPEGSNLKSWHMGATMPNRHDACCSRGCLNGLSSKRSTETIDTTPKLPHHNNKCDAPELVCHALLLLQAHRLEYECLCTFEQFVSDEECQQPCTQGGIMRLRGLILKHNARCLRGCFNGKNTATEHIEHAEIEKGATEHLKHAETEDMAARNVNHVEIEDVATEHIEHMGVEDTAVESLEAEDGAPELAEYVDIDGINEEEWDDCSVGSDDVTLV